MASGSTMRQAERQTDSDLVGTFRRFGEHGVAYEVTGLDGEGRVHIRVVETAKHLGSVRKQLLQVRAGIRPIAAS